MSDASEPCVVLPWDSAFFGFGVARVCGEALDAARAAAVDAWCRREKVRCVYFLARSDDAGTSRCAEERGFALVDVRVDFERKLEGVADLAHAGTRVRVAAAADLPALEKIARASFTDSRFYADGHFPRTQCDDLYARWVRESYRGFADAMLVAEVSGVPAGFVTCKMEAAAVGRIGLVGVDAQQRGQGLGQVMCHAACAWFAGRGAAWVRVATQGRNIASQRMYQRCGFLTRSVGLYYHKWYEVVPTPSSAIGPTAGPLA